MRYKKQSLCGFFYLKYMLEIISDWAGDRVMFKLETKGSWQQ